MSAHPVSVVIPAFESRADLATNLPELVTELDRRALGDEVLVVDDGGDDGLEAWIAATFPPPETFDSARADVRVLRKKKNVGYARAALDGARAAGHAHVLLLAPHVRVHPGFLAPLCDALIDPVVAAVSPRILRADGRGLPRIVWRAGLLEIEPTEADATDGEPTDAAYAPWCALLTRRDELLAEGFDTRFTPGDLADVDLSWTWKKSGRRVVLVPRSVVEYAPSEPEDVELTATLALRNRLLLTWKHLDAPERRREHVTALEARALEALLDGHTAELCALVAALESRA